MTGELSASFGSSMLELAPPVLLHRAMETLAGARASLSRSTRMYSAVVIPDSLATWGDVRGLAAWCEPATRVAEPYLAFVVTRFRGAIVLTPIASAETLTPGEVAATISTAHEELARLARSVAPVRI